MFYVPLLLKTTVQKPTDKNIEEVGNRKLGLPDSLSANNLKEWPQSLLDMQLSVSNPNPALSSNMSASQTFCILPKCFSAQSAETSLEREARSLTQHHVKHHVVFPQVFDKSFALLFPRDETIRKPNV